MGSPTNFNRKSTRLPEHNYASCGFYYVTICTDELVFDCRGYARVALNSMNILGYITNGQMYPNELGKIATACIEAISEHFPGVTVLKFVVMPNHVHLIILIDVIDDENRATHASPLQSNSNSGPKKRSLGSIVGSLKSAISKQINELKNTPGAILWQRNYHDRILRSENELNRTRKYITMNPTNWEKDKHNPKNTSS